MRGRRFERLAVTAALLSACSFGADGNGKGAELASATEGEGGDAMVGSSGVGLETGIPIPGPTSGGDGTVGGVDDDSDDDGIGTLTAPTSTDEGDDTDAGEESAGEDSTGPMVDPCDSPDFFSVIVTAGDPGVTITAPMASFDEPDLPGGLYFASEVEEEGLAEFPWEAPCNDEYFLWARVWDETGGAGLDDPDSYYVQMDDGGEAFWRYGCQTNPIFPEPSWYWVRVQESLTCIDIDPVSYMIDAGPHVARFRNRESGSHDDMNPPGEIAAITRVLVTNDPGFVPGETE